MKKVTPNNLLYVGMHVSSKQERINTLFSINKNGEGFYIKDGKQYTKEEFQKAYPIIEVKRNSGENIDGTRKWMY